MHQNIMDEIDAIRDSLIFCYKMAKGKVGVVGLGLGYAVEEMAKKPEVEEITVYEISHCRLIL